MTRELRAAGAAIAFLTRAPVPGAAGFDGDDVARAAAYFPLAGGLVGGAVGATAARLAVRTSPAIGAALALTAGTVATGALHLDALADTADALGTHDRERALEVMRDSRIGSFGAVALSLDIAVKLAALTCLTARDASAGAAAGRLVAGRAAAAGALSRAAPVVLAAALPYARSGDGTGVAVTRAGHGRALVAAGAAVAAAGACAGVSDGLALAATVAALTAATGAWGRRRLGGVTGDLLGATIELTETAALVAAVWRGTGR
jgi:adenosylcobinamide-GDP ribazoletransferase